MRTQKRSDFTIWIQSNPVKTKETSKQCRVYKDFFPRHRSGKSLAQKEFIEACQYLQWNHDTNTRHRS